ncbi:hydroxymethylglutaryl-coenzyme A reductase family protein, partial [Vibrio parahaemolyticus AQ3810]
KRKP